jgi:hypothetical protein
MLHDDIQRRLNPRRPPPVADQYQQPQLIVDALARHESAHVCVGIALGQRVEGAKLSRSGGSTKGTTYYNDAVDAIANLICLAAGRAGQMRYGARGRFYDDWAHDDERQMIELALDLLEAQPRRERKANALKLISGAERAAERLVDHLWDDINRVAVELVRFEELDADDITALTKDIARINFRSAALADDATLDGKPFRRRYDGYMGGRDH